MKLELSHWEFSFELYTSNLGERSRPGKNPFTGEVMTFYHDDGLSEVEIESLRKTLAINAFGTPINDEGGYSIIHSDGSSLCLFSLRIVPPICVIKCSLVVKAMTTPFANRCVRAVKDICIATNMICLESCGKSNVTFAAKISSRLADRFRPIRTIATTSELRAWLLHEVKGRKVAVLCAD